MTRLRATIALPAPLDAPTVALSHHEDILPLHLLGENHPITYAEYANGTALWWVYMPEHRDGPPNIALLTMPVVMPRHDNLMGVHIDAARALVALGQHYVERDRRNPLAEDREQVLGYFRHLSHGRYADEGARSVSSTLLSRHDYVSVGDLTVVSTNCPPRR